MLTTTLVISVLLLIVLYLWKRVKQPPNYFQLTGVRAPEPLLDFDVDTAIARPYRLKSMDPDRWIELESTYKERIQQRIQLYADHGKKIVDCLPGAESACRELMEMVVQFVVARYPGQFSVNYRTGVFTNNILGTTSNMYTDEPLRLLLHHIPEDFLITLKDQKTGLYTFRAGVSCSSIGWNVATKIGMNLQQIHTPVPDYKEKMAFSMDRFFTNMKVDKPIQRGSWGLEVGQPLFLQEDDPDYRRKNPNTTAADINLRVDWQTLRRLPNSRAIVFNFKPLFTPMTQFREEPFIPRLLLKILRDGKPSFMQYKAFEHVEEHVIPALEEWAKEQEDKGWVPRDWTERTLPEDPFFPGWEKRYA
ncbi:hypothetical protein MKEN_01064000 [Mycena kentingensis (nom. inval.)]|nr:hypothetical protein MKEN_01064000 [Mycena kentingensis (nom. inval.)]